MFYIIRILEEKDSFPEKYKLDVEVVYKTENDSIPSDVVLESLMDLIKEEITEEKEYLCRGEDWRNFEISDSNFNNSDGVISYEIGFDKMIVGKYFVTKVQSLLNDFETVIYYNDEEIPVSVEKVLPMLRYLG